MASLSAKLRSVTYGIAHWCPGCVSVHVFRTHPEEGRPLWTWDGNVDAPTCSPSMLIFVNDPETNERATLCHYFLRAGKIEFLGDSAHPLKGQTVDLPDWPYAEGEYGGV